jgi:CRISPR-associated protein Cas5h
MQKLISIDIKADFGFFRKPDTNSTVNFSYNFIHKPALLGILGAIIGLDGYKEKGKLPDYYIKLKNLPIGFAPLNHERGNFQKTVIKYSNTVGYANKGSNYLTEEATLIEPSYRVYLLADLEDEYHKQIFQNLKSGFADYIPYFGKNEHYAWWDKESYKEYDIDQELKTDKNIFITSAFIKENVINDYKEEILFDMITFMENKKPYMYFERLPIDFDETLYQYNIVEYIFTTFRLKKTVGLKNLYYIKEDKCYVQLN